MIQPDPVLGPFFVTFFEKSSVFPSKGETIFRQPSAQPCPAGQSSTQFLFFKMYAKCRTQLCYLMYAKIIFIIVLNCAILTLWSEDP